MIDPKPIADGTVFAGEFRILRPLAKGGMGAVYVAEQIGTGRERALKVMHPLLVDDETSRERFAQEAQIGAQIDSDHIVEVIGAGVDATSGMPWIAMELLKGETLAERVRRLGRLSRAEVREIFSQLGHALSAAHRKGIVHRDLKPENIFLESPRRQDVPFTAKILDFGIAKMLHGVSHTGSRGVGLGSPLWMAPEQANASELSPAADVWALGLLAYYALTGTMFWKSASEPKIGITAILMEIMVDPIAVPSERARGTGMESALPEGFDAWFCRAVMRDPALRFQDAQEAIDAFTPLLSAGSAVSFEPLPTGPATPVRATGSEKIAGTSTSAATVHLRVPPLASAPPIQAWAETGAPVTTSLRERAPGSKAGPIALLAISLLALAGAGVWFFRQGALGAKTDMPEHRGENPTSTGMAAPPSSSVPTETHPDHPVLGAILPVDLPADAGVPSPVVADTHASIAHPDTPRAGTHRPRPAPPLRGAARSLWNHAIQFCWRDFVRIHPHPGTPIKVIARLSPEGLFRTIELQGELPMTFRECVVARASFGWVIEDPPADHVVRIDAVLPPGP